MILKDLIAEFRRVADDTVLPYLWSDAELTRWANEAEREACRRSVLLIDAETDAVCRYAVSAGVGLVTLDPRVLAVRRLRLTGQTQPLTLVGWRVLEQVKPAWEDDTGTPAAAIPDWHTGAVRLYPTPVADGVLKIAAWRLPLADMALLADTPEIAPHYHRGLVNWMLALAYSKHDAETFDPQAVAFYSGEFAAQFGPPPAVTTETTLARDVSRERFAQ